MRPAALVVMAAVAGFIGGNVLQLPELFDKVSGKMADNKSEPADFWSTPAIEGYGKIHYVDTPAFKPGTTAGLSNKIVFQINRSEGDIRKPNLGLERVARVTNLYYAAGVPLDQLKFVVSINGDAVSSALNNDQFSKAYGVDNPNLKLISELKKRAFRSLSAISQWRFISLSATGSTRWSLTLSPAAPPLRPWKTAVTPS